MCAAILSFAIPFAATYSIEKKILGYVFESEATFQEYIHPREGRAHIPQEEGVLAVAATEERISPRAPYAIGETIRRLEPPASLASTITILEEVARCESNHDPLAKNNHSSAKGLLQILDGTWKHFRCEGDVYSPEDNFRCGLKIATESGLHHWDESRFCWNRTYHEVVRR
jgi:hypothetical protein